MVIALMPRSRDGMVKLCLFPWSTTTKSHQSRGCGVVGAEEGRRVEATRKASSAVVSSILCGTRRPPVWFGERKEVGEE
jgi:hypothetical protein